jgi:hypothetical protein
MVMMRGHGNLELGQGCCKTHTLHVQHSCDVLKTKFMLRFDAYARSDAGFCLSNIHHMKLMCHENVNHGETPCGCAEITGHHSRLYNVSSQSKNAFLVN